MSANESTQLKLKIHEESEEKKFKPDREVSIENKNKFFEMLKKITPPTTSRNLRDNVNEESKNTKSELSEPSQLQQDRSIANKNKFFEMLNAIKPLEEKKVDNKDLEVVEVKDKEGQEGKIANPKPSAPGV